MYKKLFRYKPSFTLVILSCCFIIFVFTNVPALFKVTSPHANTNALEPLTTSKQGYEVFGFAPYWTLSQLDNIDFNILTTFAYFGIDVDENGNLDTLGNGYQSFKSQQATNLFRKAHAAGTRVVVTLTQMDENTILALMDNPNGQVNAINQIVDLVDKRGIDGVNIDFEYGQDAGPVYRNKFSAFISNLTSAMHKRITSSKVTVSVYASAVKNPKIYDIPSLSRISDGIFMMAYDFATVGSDNAIPTDPLYGYKQGKYWYDISTAVNDFLTQMPASKLILGLPWYGYDYPVYSPQVNATTLPYWAYGGDAKTDTYAVTSDQITPTVVGDNNFRTGWDSYGEVGYKAYLDQSTGTWRMVFIDDVKSMGLKYDFAKRNSLAGVGIWAMGFDNGTTDFWNLLNQKFGLKLADSSVLQRKIVDSQ